MSKITSLIGITTIFFVSLTVLTIIFPSLFSSIFGKFSTNLIPYELGIFGVPVILSNLALLIFGITYYKKKLPSSLSNSINRIRTFEIPKKPTLIILLIIFGIYIGVSTPELFLDESKQWGDYGILEDALKIWPDGESENIYVEEQNDRYVRMFLLDTSQKIFQNIKNIRFDRITGIPKIPISYGIKLVENFPNVDENNDGKMIVIIVNETKKIITMPIRFEIFDMK